MKMPAIPLGKGTSLAAYFGFGALNKKEIPHTLIILKTGVAIDSSVCMLPTHAEKIIYHTAIHVIYRYLSNGIGPSSVSLLARTGAYTR